jgi:hypothetical protein
MRTAVGSLVRLVPEKRGVPSNTDVDDTFHRLATWLAAVSADAASAPQASPTPLPARPRGSTPR